MGIYTLSFVDSCLSRHVEARRVDNPLDCIADHHLAEREVCVLLDRLASAGGRGVSLEDLDDVIAFLAVDLPLHLQDEAEELFPRLRVRCAPEDEIGRAIDRLTAEHAYSGEETDAVLEILRAMRGGTGTIDQAGCKALSAYAGHARRHLIFENAVILPIARARLEEADLAAMRRNMMDRRRIAAIKGL